MSFVFAQLEALDALGPAPGYQLASEKGFPWPRVHYKPGAIIMSRVIGSGTFGNVRSVHIVGAISAVVPTEVLRWYPAPARAQANSNQGRIPGHCSVAATQLGLLSPGCLCCSLNIVAVSPKGAVAMDFVS